MNTFEKTTLIVGALLWGGWWAYNGMVFSAIAEPEEFDLIRSLFWVAFGVVIATPFWMPAVISGIGAGVIKLFSLVCFVFVLVLAVHQTYFDINRSIRGQDVPISEIALDTLIAIFSVCCAVIVFRCGRKKHVK